MLQRTLDKLHAKDWSLSNKEVSAAGAFLPYIGDHAPEALTARVVEAFVYEKSEAVCERMFLDLVEHDRFGTAKLLLQAAADNGKNPQLAASMLTYSNGGAFRHAYSHGHQDFTDMLVDTAQEEGRKLGRPTLAGDMLGHAGYRLLGKIEEQTEDAPEKDNDRPERTQDFLQAVRRYGERLGQPALMRDVLAAGEYDMIAGIADGADRQSLRLVIDEAKAIGPQMAVDMLTASNSYPLLAGCRKGDREGVQLMVDTMREASAQLGKPELMHEFLGARDGMALLVAMDNKAYDILHDLVGEMKALPTQEGQPSLLTQAFRGNNANLLGLAANTAPLAEVDWLLEEIKTEGAKTGQPRLLVELLETGEYFVLRDALLSAEPDITERFLKIYKEEGAAAGRPDMLLEALTAKGFEAPIIAPYSRNPETMAQVLAALDEEAQAHGKPELPHELLVYDKSRFLYNASCAGEPAALSAALGLAETWRERSGDPQPLVTCLTEQDYCPLYMIGMKGHTEAAGIYFDTLERTADSLGKPELMLDAFAPKSMIGLAFSLVHGHEETTRTLTEKAKYTAEKYGKPELLGALLDNDMVRYTNFAAQRKDNAATAVMLDFWDEAAQITGDAALKERAEAARASVECMELAREQDVAGIAGKLDTLSDEMRKLVVDSFPGRMQNAFAEDMPENARLREMGRGNKRWNAVLRMDAPHPELESLSPQGFSPKVFKQLLPVIEQACELEGCADKAPVMAYKASLLFSNPQELDRYLTAFAAKSAKTHTPVSEALSFDAPKRGQWTPKLWKDAALQYGEPMIGLVRIAPEIEAYLKEHDLPFPQSPREMRPVAAQIIYERAEENPRFAEAALEYKLDDKTFERGLDLMKDKPKTADKLPDVTIDGKAVGQENYYFTKLEPDDPRGLLLGEITNCCQSIGSAGERFAIHGATSENSGFYVWKQKTKGEMTPADPIIAQSWAWIGEQGELVLDSFESLDKKTYQKLVEPFMGAFAEQALGKHRFTVDLPDGRKDFTLKAIHMGCGGYDDLEYSNRIDLPYPMAELAVRPIDLDGELPDSKKQYVVASLRGQEIAPPAEKTWAQRIRDQQAATQQAQIGM